MTLFGYTLRFLRARKNLSLARIGEDLGLGVTTLENIESGYILPEDAMARAIADYFGVTVGYMKGSVEFSVPPRVGKETDLQSPKRYVRLRPITISGEENQPALHQYREIDEVVLPLSPGDRSGYIAVQVTDNSMARYRALAGDLLVVREDPLKIRKGDLVLLLSLDGHAILRRYFPAEGDVLLRSDNDDLLPPIRLSHCDKTWRLVGSVVKIIIETDADFLERCAQNPPSLPEEILPPPDTKKQEGQKQEADYMYLYK